MPALVLAAVGRPEVKPYAITERLRSQLVYFMTAPGAEGTPALGDGEYWLAAEEVSKWLDEGVFYLVSPLDTANMTEVEITEEQEALFNWLQKQQVEHVRVIEGRS